MFALTRRVAVPVTAGKPRLGLLAAGGVALVGFAVLAALDVQACPLPLTTGVPCPGCGLVRALLAVGRLDLAAAAHFHPLVFAVAPLLAMEAAAAAIPAVGRWRAGWQWTPLAAGLAGVLLAGVWLTRLAGGLGGHPDW